MKMRKWFLLALAAASAMCMGTVCAAEDEVHMGEGVYISDMDVSGMSKAEAEAVVKQRIEKIRSDVLTVQVGEDSVEATTSELGLHWENMDVVDEALAIGNSGNPIKRYKEQKDLAQQPKVLPLQFSAGENAVRTFIDKKCKQFEKEAQEVSVSADGSGGIDIQPGVTGQVINVEDSVKAVQDFIGGEWQGGSGTIALAVELDEPRGNKEDLESIQDLLGTYTTSYGSTSGRNMNVERAAELINNHIVFPGETFSVCEHLVPFTAENGYELAPEYAMGRVVQGYGGGVCQVSTTLYNALLLAEIEIVERHNHTMPVTYVPTSMDAAIAEGAMDLVFRNNLDTPILISGYAYGGELTFSIWGKETRPADRYISYYGNILSQSDPGGVQLYAAPDQPVGYFNQVQSPMGGETSECRKTVTYNGETTDEQVNTSVYQATPASYEVGTLGASDALLNAIYANDLAAAQAAAMGITTPTSETTASETTTSETTQTDTPVSETTQTDVPVTEAPVVQTPETTAPDVYYDPSVQGDVYYDPSMQGGGTMDEGVITW